MLSVSCIDTVPNLTNAQCEAIWEQIVKSYRKYLKKYHVKIPCYGSAQSYWLICLYHHIGHFVHKDVISDFTREHITGVCNDQQVRHLNKQKGWYVTTKGQSANGTQTPAGYHMLVTIKEPSPIWKYESSKRETILSAKDFDELKKAYNDKCACCGALEGTLDNRTGRIVKLQQGHKDPSKSLTMKNSIPQCEYCNQYSLDRFVYNENGKIVSIRDANWILAHTTSEALEDLKILLELEK